LTIKGIPFKISLFTQKKGIPMKTILHTYDTLCKDFLGAFETELEKEHKIIMCQELADEIMRRDKLIFDGTNRVCHNCNSKMHSHSKTDEFSFLACCGYIIVRLHRLYCRNCRCIVIPGESLIPKDRITAVVSERMCDLASKMSYAKANDSLALQHGITISNTKFWEHLQKEAAKIEDLVEKQAKSLYEAGVYPECVDLKHKKPLIIGIDGGFVPEWKTTSSFEVKCATITTGSNIGPGKKRHLVDRIGYAAQCSVNEFRQRVSLLALKSGYQTASIKIFVSDGATWISNMIDTYFPDAIHVLDMYHLKNKVIKLFGFTAEGYDLKLRELAISTCNNYDPKKLIAILSLYNPADLSKLTARDDLINYVQNNSKAIENHHYVHIHGSGWIEKGVDLMISRRLKNRGMAWTINGCANMLPFAILRYNSQWDVYWRHRKGFSSSLA
jgi:hypothetical protein